MAKRSKKKAGKKAKAGGPSKAKLAEFNKRLDACFDRLDGIEKRLGLLMTDKVPEGAQSVAPTPPAESQN
jgi:hypothetical protein